MYIFFSRITAVHSFTINLSQNNYLQCPKHSLFALCLQPPEQWKLWLPAKANELTFVWEGDKNKGAVGWRQSEDQTDWEH